MSTEPIPEQNKGKQSDVGDHIDSSTNRQAHSNFVVASRRLLNVNRWGEMAGQVSAKFQLTDSNGTHVERLARVGDHIRIDIPGPGLATGHGYDWVRVESIEDKPDPGAAYESLVMTVRPTSSPVNDEKDVAHFFDDSATSTFMVERKDLQVVASVHGRNEVPNKNMERTVDKIRNTVVANAATSGIAAFQWTLLSQGLLKDL
jgi:hypothetical protein